jgi:2-iminobutanoate/2-iminopropanoate deaminase
MSKIVVPPLKGSKGPWSEAVRVGNWVFLAGQTPDDNKADIRTQTRQVLQNMRKTLEKAGATMDNIVHVYAYFTDIVEDYAGMNEVYKEFFKKDFPARCTLQVEKLEAGPSTKIKIDAIAFVP